MIRFGCHCDLEPGMAPDGCVIDKGRAADCAVARRLLAAGLTREACADWRPVAGDTAASPSSGHPTAERVPSGSYFASRAARGIYFASKTAHAPRWREMRAAGVPTTATWIDEAEEGQSGDYAELAQRCLDEIMDSTAVLLYCEPGETLKGALIEAGMALAAGVPVLCVGECESLSRVFRRHPLWFGFRSIEDALAFLPDSLLAGVRSSEQVAAA